MTEQRPQPEGDRGFFIFFFFSVQLSRQRACDLLQIRIWAAQDAALRLQGASPIVNYWTIRAYQLRLMGAYRWIKTVHVRSTPYFSYFRSFSCWVWDLSGGDYSATDDRLLQKEDVSPYTPYSVFGRWRWARRSRSSTKIRGMPSNDGRSNWILSVVYRRT